MKVVPEGELEYGRILSEGKLLEVIPVIEDAVGQPMILPPAVWRVGNEFLGFQPHHTLHMPIQFFSNQRIQIPGSNANNPFRLTFLIRLLEDGEMPNASASYIDATAVRELIQAIQTAPIAYPSE